MRPKVSRSVENADNKATGSTQHRSSTLRDSPCFASVVRQTNGEVNISHETTTVVVWIYDGI